MKAKRLNKKPRNQKNKNQMKKFFTNSNLNNKHSKLKKNLK